MVTVLGVLVAGQTQADSLDNAVDSPIISIFHGHRTLSLWLAFPGSRIPAFGVTAAIVVWCLLARRLNVALLAVVAVVLAAGLTDYVIKPLVDRTYLGFLVYPSGHTSVTVSLAATLAVLVLPATVSPRRSATRRRLAVLVLVLGCLVAIMVAVAVIGLRWHYFTDTVAGAAVGIGTVCGVTLVLDLPRVRRRLRI